MSKTAETNKNHEKKKKLEPQTSAPVSSPNASKKRKSSVARNMGIGDSLKILACNSVVPFQGVPVPYIPDYDDQLIEFTEAMKLETPLILLPVVNPSLRPERENMSQFGAIVKVMKILDLPDGKKNIFLMAESRVKVDIQVKIGDSVFLGSFSQMPDTLPPRDFSKFLMVMDMIVETYDYVKNYFSELAHIQMSAPKELQDDAKTYINFIIVTSPLDYAERLQLSQNNNLYKRAELLLVYLDKIKQQIDLRREIFSKTMANMEKEQRTQFLRTQIKQIQSEIGEDEESDILELNERADHLNWNEAARKHFDKELGKLSRYNPNSPDYAIQYTYLDTLLNLPWNHYAEGDIDLRQLKTDLDKDHFGLEKIKERILEHTAVLKLRGDMRSPILCLYGPPGVGKTSLCKSIADSIGRDYCRVSLGGLHDETQIRGHRRTYIGALPGRIISALSKVETGNPVFVLDEIDKIGNDYRGDPAQALLEVLDPEQNSTFHDNYLDVDYDLSKIFFIATANSVSSISKPLLDRMELIEVSGYIIEEKIEIAKRHLIPKQLEFHGFEPSELQFTEDAIRVMIESYTRESGVRKLEKNISAILRKIAVKKASRQKFDNIIDGKDVLRLLGKEEVVQPIYEGHLPVGVVIGLAWTSVGGEILYFESSLSKGKGVLTLTGNLGDVMKESATIAYQWVKANAERLGIDAERFSNTDLHLHVPEGAVPKDGPSAGITMVCSIVGSFTAQSVKAPIAMTGEVTLSGKVLPVGGIKEKILAAKRAGLKEIILSAQNRKDIEEIKKVYLKGLKFHYVENVMDVLKIVFVIPEA